jgi:class 3 adenylate cyclase
VRQRRFRTLDGLLLGSVVLLWSACFVLHLEAALRGHLAWIPVTIAGAPEASGFPSVQSFWRGDVAQASGLLPGDRLLAVGAAPLAGRSTLATAARIYAEAAGALAVSVRVERDGEVLVRSLPLRPMRQSWRASLLAAAFFGVGALAFWRAPRLRAVRLFFLATAAYSLHWCYFWGGGGPARNLVAFAVFAGGLGAGLPLALRAALSFPADVARDGRAATVGPWAFAAAGIGALGWALGWPLPTNWGLLLTVGSSVAVLATIIALLGLHWVRTGPIGRRQIKWVLLGALLAFTPPLLCGAAAVARPEWWWLYDVSLTALLVFPVAILIALVRDHLFDIDRLLTATACSALLGALLLASVIALVPNLSHAAQSVVDPKISQPALALLCGLAVMGARSRVQPWMDRVLFPERERFEAGAAALRRQLDDCEKPAELFCVLGEGLTSLLTPDSVVIYGHAADLFAPLFQDGPAAAPSFPPEGPLASELEAEGRVVDVGTLTARLAADPLARAERAALQAMGTQLLLPVVLRTTLAGFVCLGAKRSGREYGASELALLQGLVDKAGDELSRFALEEVHRDQQGMCERLRRYVPGAVATRLEQGVEPPVGECEVAVLFVDLRGYTRLSEQRSAEAVFSFVNRYTETVSAVVKRHGGAVVDFQGDGLMAVFGAPDPHPEKELAALRAAREILVAVRELSIEAGPGGEHPDLGVGIATGPAFVGNVRAVDRAIWTVLGDTTNLAARFQALTRELDADIIIDGRTHAAADMPADFERAPQETVRGRRKAVEIFALPARPRAAALQPALEEPT